MFKKKGMLLIPDLPNAATRLTIITNCKPKVAGKGLLVWFNKDL